MLGRAYSAVPPAHVEEPTLNKQTHFLLHCSTDRSQVEAHLQKPQRKQERYNLHSRTAGGTQVVCWEEHILLSLLLMWRNQLAISRPTSSSTAAPITAKWRHIYKNLKGNKRDITCVAGRLEGLRMCAGKSIFRCPSSSCGGTNSQEADSLPPPPLHQLQPREGTFTKTSNETRQI